MRGLKHVEEYFANRIWREERPGIRGLEVEVRVILGRARVAIFPIWSPMLQSAKAAYLYAQAMIFTN